MNKTINNNNENASGGLLTRIGKIIKKYKLASAMALGIGISAGSGVAIDILKNKQNSIMGNIPELKPSNRVEKYIGSPLITGKNDKILETTQELISPGSTYNKENIGAFMKAFPVGSAIQFIAPNSEKRNYGFIKNWSLGKNGQKGGALIEFVKTDGTRVTMETGWGDDNLKALKRFNFGDFTKDFPFSYIGKGLNATQIGQKLGLNITYKDWPKISGTIVSINGDIITDEYNIPANTHYAVAKNKLEAKFISEFLKTKISSSGPITIKYEEKKCVKEVQKDKVELPKNAKIEKVEKKQESNLIVEKNNITPKNHNTSNIIKLKVSPKVQDIQKALSSDNNFRKKFIKLFYPQARNMEKVASHYGQGEARMGHLDKIAIEKRLKQDIEKFLNDAGYHNVTGEQLFKAVCRAESGGLLTEEIISKYLETGNFGYVKSVLHHNFTVNKQCKGSGQMQTGYIKDGAKSFCEETGKDMKVSTASSDKIKETFGLLKKGVSPEVVLEKIKEVDSRFDTQKIVNIIIAKFKEISDSMKNKGINAKDALYLATMAYSHGENFAEKVGDSYSKHIQKHPNTELKTYLVGKGFSSSSLEIVDRKITHLELYAKANIEAEKRVKEMNNATNLSADHIKETDLKTGESKIIKVDFTNKSIQTLQADDYTDNRDSQSTNKKVDSILDNASKNSILQSNIKIPKLSGADDYRIEKTEYAEFVKKHKITYNFTEEDIANIDANKTKTVKAFESFVSSSKYDLSKEAKILTDKFMEYYIISQYADDYNEKTKASENCRNVVNFGMKALERKNNNYKLIDSALTILPSRMHNLFKLDVENYLNKNPGHTTIQAVEYLLEDNKQEINAYTGERAPLLLRDRNKQLKNLLSELRRLSISSSISSKEKSA